MKRKRIRRRWSAALPGTRPRHPQVGTRPHGSALVWRSPRVWSVCAVVGVAALGIIWVVWRSPLGVSLGKQTPPATSPQTPAALPVGVASAPGPSAAAQVDRALVEQVNRGNDLLAQGKPAEAVAVLEEAVKMRPEDEDVHYNLGIALARLGKVEEAIQHYREALRIFPDYLEAHNNLGNLLLRGAQLDEAADHFRAAIKIMPDYASGYNNLGTTLQQKGQLDEATRQFERAVALNPDYWEARYNLGQSYLQQGQTQKARAEFQRVLEAHPDFAPARLALQRAEEPPPALQPIPP